MSDIEPPVAHAGRVSVSAGQDAVEAACTTAWGAIRADIAVLAKRTPELEAAADRVRALREVAPSWAGDPPAWAIQRSQGREH